MGAARKPPTEDVVPCPHCKTEGVTKFWVYSGYGEGRVGVHTPIGCGYCHRSGWVGADKAATYRKVD